MVYSYLLSIIKERACFFALLDPDAKLSEKNIKTICTGGADAILVGGSTVGENFNKFTKLVKSYANVPVIIFPGDAMQVSQYADSILFLSLLSGRNPDYLIGEHTKAASTIKRFAIEVIPTGYILVAGGCPSSVVYKSKTSPIPANGIEEVKAHALAGEYLGMKFIYLEAGSGAKYSISEKMISEVKEYINIPLIVGGGIKTPDEVRAKVKAGANFVVVGNILQKEPELIRAFASAMYQ